MRQDGTIRAEFAVQDYNGASLIGSKLDLNAPANVAIAIAAFAVRLGTVCQRRLHMSGHKVDRGLKP